jgi:hypothetical protein
MKSVYNALVGYQLSHKLGTINILGETKRNQWRTDVSSNKAVSKVYTGLLNITNYADSTKNGSKLIDIPLLKVTPQYRKFTNEFFNLFTPNAVTANCGSFDDIVKCGYEIGITGHPAISIYATEEMLDCDFGDYQLALAPYNDGVMLVSLTIDKSERGNGTGTFVMNSLYDISEELNIPIYLTPYPAEQFKSKKEKELVERLEKWYDKLEFGPVSVGSHLWSNFE